MSMFKNEKMPDTATAAKAPGRDQPEPASPPPAPVETPRVHAVAQPIATVSSVQASAASVISKALKITGQLESTEDIQIEGEVDGDIRAVAVRVGTNAKVKGTVYGEEVELSGTVDGKIEAKKVVLTKTAHMSGDIIHQDIRVESGAYLDGHCRPDFGKSETRSLNPVPKPVIAAGE